jgi:hypothetical protein
MPPLALAGPPCAIAAMQDVPVGTTCVHGNRAIGAQGAGSPAAPGARRGSTRSVLVRVCPSKRAVAPRRRARAWCRLASSAPVGQAPGWAKPSRRGRWGRYAPWASWRWTGRRRARAGRDRTMDGGVSRRPQVGSAVAKRSAGKLWVRRGTMPGAGAGRGLRERAPHLIASPCSSTIPRAASCVRACTRPRRQRGPRASAVGLVAPGDGHHIASPQGAEGANQRCVAGGVRRRRVTFHIMGFFAQPPSCGARHEGGYAESQVMSSCARISRCRSDFLHVCSA